MALLMMKRQLTQQMTRVMSLVMKLARPVMLIRVPKRILRVVIMTRVGALAMQATASAQHPPVMGQKN